MKSLKNGEYEYRESDFLGEGSFAKVYRGIIVKTQRVIAVRLLSLKLIKQFGHKIKSIISKRCSKTRSGSVRPQVTLRNSRTWLSLHNQDIWLLSYRAQCRHDSRVLSWWQSLGRRFEARTNSWGRGTRNIISTCQRIAIYFEEKSSPSRHQAWQRLQ